jgi:predicted component of type VI protein secretion system
MCFGNVVFVEGVRILRGLPMDVNLVMFKPDGQRKDFPLTNAVSVVGRGEECELQIPLLNVSRRHSELRLDGDIVRVKDLASSNGTYLNNQRISEGELSAGDRLAIGPIVFTVQIDGLPGEVSPIKSEGQVVAEGSAIDGPTVITEDIAIEIEPEATEDVASAPAAVIEPIEIPKVVEPVAVAPAPAPAPESESSEPLDPISALEALAAESRKKGK